MVGANPSFGKDEHKRFVARFGERILSREELIDFQRNEDAMGERLLFMDAAERSYSLTGPSRRSIADSGGPPSGRHARDSALPGRCAGTSIPRTTRWEDIPVVAG